MKKIAFATHNPNKLYEVRQMLPPGLKLLSLSDIGCRENIPETAKTLEGNAKLKADYIKEHYGYDCFADDTGLEVETLGGAPGVYSARFAGPEADAALNMDKLLRLLHGEKNRKAHFRTVIALTYEGEYHFFEGTAPGVILMEPGGKGGFGYDPIFQPEGYALSYAQMPMAEKNQISHRGKAFRKLQAFLEEINTA